MNLLILVYAIVILGGLGSITGVPRRGRDHQLHVRVPRAAERSPRGQALALLRPIVLLVLLIKPLIRPVLVLAATVGFGFAVHAIVAATTAGVAWTAWRARFPAGSWINHWAVIPGMDPATGVAHGNFNNSSTSASWPRSSSR